MNKYFFKYSHYSDEYEVRVLAGDNIHSLVASFISRSDAELFANVKNGDWTVIALNIDEIEVSQISSKTYEDNFEIKCGRTIESEDFKR